MYKNKTTLYLKNIEKNIIILYNKYHEWWKIMPNNNLNMQQLIEMRVQKIYEKMNWCIKENNLIDIFI